MNSDEARELLLSKTADDPEVARVAGYACKLWEDAEALSEAIQGSPVLVAWLRRQGVELKPGQSPLRQLVIWAQNWRGE